MEGSSFLTAKLEIFYKLFSRFSKNVIHFLQAFCAEGLVLHFPLYGILETIKCFHNYVKNKHNF